MISFRYSVNEPQLREMTEWLLTNEKSRIFPKAAIPAAPLGKSTDAADRMTAAMMGHNNLSQPTLYLAHALNAMPDTELLKKLGWQKVAEHFSSAQMDDGSFAGRKGWPPIFNTPQIHTLFAATALTDVSPAVHVSAGVRHRLERTLARANHFLEPQAATNGGLRQAEALQGLTPDDTHQGIVLRLLRQTQSTSDAQSSTLMDTLRQQQRADGGWVQTADRDSDAFATGQSLYALKKSGLTTDDATIRGGIEFLIRTQQADGTWPMTSRPNPETGKPADFLNPITYAAAAWATLGLTSQVAK